jgi:hypothetical protein
MCAFAQIDYKYSQLVRAASAWDGGGMLPVAQLAHICWFFGNLYEAVVDMPRLLADAQPNRKPGLLAAGSPLRYYAPIAPVTFVATSAILINSWRSRRDRRAVVTAAAGTASATAITVHLVRTVNLRLLRSTEPLSAGEARALTTRWHRENLMRLLGLAVSGWALRQLSSGRNADRRLPPKT